MTDDLADRVDRAAAAAGVELLPWQRVYLRAVMSGDLIVWHRGRRGGWTTVHRVAAELNKDQP
jgi:hypothetical protein